MKSKLIMDKNKSVFKLKGIPSVFWLNLDKDSHRREYMEDQLDYWEIENHTRISGYDGRSDDVSCYLKGVYPENMIQNEVGCCLSHLKAIKYFYENTTEDVALILEDDVVFDVARFWNFTWKEFISKLPYDWDCIQLTTICTGNIHIKLHNHFINDFSAAAYLITRHHASKIVKNHIRGEKYKLDNKVKPRAVSEDLIFGSGKTYTIPLLLYSLNLGSSIHPEHIDIYHKQSYDAIYNYWQQNGPDLNISDLMDYDPYLGRISEPTLTS